MKLMKLSDKLFRLFWLIEDDIDVNNRLLTRLHRDPNASPLLHDVIYSGHNDLVGYGDDTAHLKEYHQTLQSIDIDKMSSEEIYDVFKKKYQ